MSGDNVRTVRVKVTWETYTWEMLRILLNPNASLPADARQEVVDNLLKIARMADKYAELMEE